MAKQSTNNTFQAAIIDPGLDRRAVLRGVLRVVFPHAACHTFTSFEHVSARENHHAPEWQVVFISGRLGSSMAQTLQSCKGTRRGANAVYIAIERSGAGVATIANRIAEGFAAVLTEPYSADAVADVTKLALELRTQQRAIYERRVVKLLVREICDQVDVVAKLKITRRPANLSMYLLAEMCAALPTLPDEVQAIYFDELCEITSRAKPAVRETEPEMPAVTANSDDQPLMRMAGAI